MAKGEVSASLASRCPTAGCGGVEQVSAGRSIPVIVGAAELANKDPERLRTAVELAHEAVERAAAARPVLLDHLGAVYAPPSSVFAERTLADELGERLGVAGPRVSSGFSGASPLTLLAEACGAVCRGDATVAVVAGAVAEASVRNARRQGLDIGPQAAPWSQGSGARQDLPADDPRVRAFRGAESFAGVTGPSEIFALLESAMAAAAGRDQDAQRRFLGELMAPFTAVAATRPELAWFPVERRPEELSTVTPDNRMISEPYPKRMNSFPTVDLAAAVLVTTDEVADRLGVPADERVYPWSTGHCAEAGPPSTRPVFHESVALRAAIEAALRHAGLGVADCTAFDLYSCFPAAVQLSTGVLGLAPDDPRRLTLTGGLPYFGGPGANYVTHAIAAAVARCRRGAGERALVVGVGGAPSDFAASVFAPTAPTTPWGIDRCEDVRATLEATRVPIDPTRTGEARVVAATVVHAREMQPVRGGVIVEFPDGTRAGAMTRNASQARQMAGQNWVGRSIQIYLGQEHLTFDAE